jgi:hypothetical protein
MQSFAQVIPYDKKLHFCVGAFVSAGVYSVVYYQTGNKWIATFSAVGGAFVAGIGKETIDYFTYGKGKPFFDSFDLKDIAATTLGSVPIVITFTFTIQKIIKPRKK